MPVLFSTKRVALAALAAVVAGSTGCAGLKQPFSQVDGRRYFLTNIDTFPVLIIRVDDRDTLDNPTFIEPGLRKVVVQGPPDGARRFGEQRTFELNAAPCKRYYLVAVKPNRLVADFTVRIDFEEPIGGCSIAPSK